MGRVASGAQPWKALYWGLVSISAAPVTLAAWRPTVAEAHTEVFMSSFLVSAPQFSNMLGNLERWLDKGVEYASSRGFDPNVLLASRLAPDQFPLLKQVQIACDTAKLSCALITGKEAPKHPDTEQTLAELKARIASVRGYLDSFVPADFDAIGSRIVSPPALKGRSARAEDYLAGFSLPNFYFHVTTAYAILRHNGVPLGKLDYIGRIKLAD